MKEEDVHLIDRAMRHELSDEEKASYNARLQTDEAFRRLHEDLHLMTSSIKSLAVEKQLKQIEQEGSHGSSLIPFSLRQLALAASLLFIVVTGIWLYMSRSQDLVNQYYTTYNEMEILPSRGSVDLHGLKIRALDAYKLHQIALALTILDSAFSMSSDDEDVLALTGLCRMEESSYQKALEAFNRIEQISGSEPALTWYKALAFLGLKDYAKSRELLQQLKEAETSPFKTRASELLEKIPEG